MKNIVAVALAVCFVLALAVPAFAMTHSVTYDMDGTIEYKRQAGHECNTGGVHKQTIAGTGEMSKVSAISMTGGIISMTDTNDFVAGETSLVVTSVIELCMPPKYVYEGNSMFTDGTTLEAPVGFGSIYGAENHPASADRTDTISGTTHTELASILGWEALTDQIWAVQVAADPGFSGNLHQDFTAADGSYWGHDAQANNWFANDADWIMANTDGSGSFRREADADGVPRWVPGANYVGSYFDMEQTARTSMGEVKRYIDISSPRNHSYLMEDMSVVGKSEIVETFNLQNVAPGDDVPGLWWDLF